MQTVSFSLWWVDVLSNHLTNLKNPFSQFSPIYQGLPQTTKATTGNCRKSTVLLVSYSPLFIHPRMTFPFFATWLMVPTASHTFFRVISSQDMAQLYMGPIKIHWLFSFRLLMGSKSFCTGNLSFISVMSSSDFDLISKIDP